MRPLSIMTRTLRAVLPPHSCDSITGDLLEEFQERARNHPGQAQRWYARQLWSFIAAAPWFGFAASACCAGVISFALASVWILTRAEFSPAVAVAVYLLVCPITAFTVAHRSGRFRIGFIAAQITAASVNMLAFGLIAAFHLRHPPSSSAILPIFLCTAASAIGALTGKCLAERIESLRI